MTEDVYDQQYKLVAGCPQQGKCDNSTYRATHSSGNLVVSLTVHIMNSATGKSPDGVTPSVATTMLQRVNSAYGAYGVSFTWTIVEHNDNAYYCIPGYSGTNQNWYNAIQGMKTQYAVNPTSTLNVFISCMDPSLQGVLFGIATFPWDPAAITKTGGLWLNGIAVDSEAQLKGDVTFEHELGHCLGLWHTFHGSDEILGCNLDCEELPHALRDPPANEVGDFCSDTPATPRDYACSSPTGDACNGKPWGNTDYTNYMGYGMDPQPCGNHFTDEQELRIKCWTCDALPGLTQGC
jgi:hypothetical protein